MQTKVQTKLGLVQNRIAEMGYAEQNKAERLLDEILKIGSSLEFHPINKKTEKQIRYVINLIKNFDNVVSKNVLIIFSSIYCNINHCIITR